jgi:Uma2 family endonuclease
VELVFGEIVEMSPVGWLHRIGTGLVTCALERAFATGHFVDVQQPLSVPGTVPGSEPQLDVAVFTGNRRDYINHPTVAILVIEVADATLAYDLTTKAELYATAGVADYWVLDVTNRQLHVFRDPAPLPQGLGATAYQTHLTLGTAEQVVPLAAPSASVLVSELLP